MNTPFLDIHFDLHQKTPNDLQDFPPPYDDRDNFEEKFLKIRRAYGRAKRSNGRVLQLINAYFLGKLLEKEADTPLQRSYYAQQLSQHLYTVSVRLYYIFEFLGTKQILRSLRTNVTMIRQLSAAEYRSLVNEAFLIFTGGENFAEGTLSGDF